MRRLSGALFVAIVAASVAAGSVSAAKPVVTVDLRFNGITELDPDLTQACGFSVFATVSGRYRETTYFNKDGSIQKIMAHPSFRQTLTSRYGSLTTDDRGLDKVTFNPDGTVLIHGTGIHLRVKGEAYAIGLWRLTIDPETGELLDQEYHGRFDLLAPEILEWVCDRLGPS